MPFKDPVAKRRYAKQYYKKHRAKRDEQHRIWNKVNPEKHRASQKRRNKRYYLRHMEQEAERQAAYRATEAGRQQHNAQEMLARFNNPEKYLWKAAKQRAARLEVPFTIAVSDIVIPKYCPVLDIELNFRVGHGRWMPDSPSLERVIPELGYVPGNVCIISWQANRIKTDATLDELEALAMWARKIIPEVRAKFGYER